MSMWAIVPVKALAASKSRLADVLEAEERENLVLQMLTRTLRLLRECTPPLAGTLVVTTDVRLLEIARGLAATPIRESEAGGLNEALGEGLRQALGRGAHAVVVFPADLPDIERQDILTLIDSLPPAPGMAIAPDRHRQGTNALAMCPPGLIEFDFGLRSFDRHCARAGEQHASLVIVERPGLALDVDTPDDLRHIQHVLS